MIGFVCLLSLILTTSNSFGQMCPNVVFKGHVQKSATAFDRFLKAHQGKTPTIKQLNALIAREGLPFRVQSNNRPDYVEVKTINGVAPVVFLKRLDLKEGLDPVYEVSDIHSQKTLKTWHLPAEHGYPMAINGNELIFNQALTPFCGPPSLTTGVRLAVKPDGSFKAVNIEIADALKEVSDCPAKALLPHGKCAGVPDLKTDGDDLRLLVFQLPQN